ncbi:MAG: phasin family protein [Gammaproteobacteria bacterium]|jgi:phage FluMu protein gp41|nr:MAG: phasin family protein [Gammaproteobacteria bacterium]
MPEMTSSAFDFSAFMDASRKAMAPAHKFSELALQSFERMARQQYAFAGEVLEFSVQELQLLSSAKDFNELTAKQLEIASQFAEKAAQRSQDLVKLATDQQAQVSKWFDQTAVDTARTARKAA